MDEGISQKCITDNKFKEVLFKKNVLPSDGDIILRAPLILFLSFVITRRSSGDAQRGAVL
jgi:hypothetical protein